MGQISLLDQCFLLSGLVFTGPSRAHVAVYPAEISTARELQFPTPPNSPPFRPFPFPLLGSSTLLLAFPPPSHPHPIPHSAAVRRLRRIDPPSARREEHPTPPPSHGSTEADGGGGGGSFEEAAGLAAVAAGQVRYSPLLRAPVPGLLPERQAPEGRRPLAASRAAAAAHRGGAIGGVAGGHQDSGAEAGQVFSWDGKYWSCAWSDLECISWRLDRLLGLVVSCLVRSS